MVLKIALVGETNFLDLFAVLGKFCGLGKYRFLQHDAKWVLIELTFPLF